MLEGRVEGTRLRGKPRINWEENFKHWSGLKLQEYTRMAEDRVKWRDVAINLRIGRRYLDRCLFCSFIILDLWCIMSILTRHTEAQKEAKEERSVQLFSIASCPWSSRLVNCIWRIFFFFLGIRFIAVILEYAWNVYFLEEDYIQIFVFF